MLLATPALGVPSMLAAGRATVNKKTPVGIDADRRS